MIGVKGKERKWCESSFPIDSIEPIIYFPSKLDRKEEGKWHKEKNIYKITHTFSLSTFNNKGRVVI